VAGRSGDLGLAVDRLPPLLAELEPAARELGGLAREGRPLVKNLQPAAKPLYDLLGDFEPLSKAAAPVLVKLDRLAKTGRKTVAAAAPVVRDLRPTSTTLLPIARTAADLTESLRDKGVLDNVLEYLYVGTAALARFDRYSHILPAYLLGTTCNMYATEPDPKCSAHYEPGRRAEAKARKAGPARKAKADARKPDAQTQALDYLLGK
jgi:ABC-type transporter Mla subunit MlaD